MQVHRRVCQPTFRSPASSPDGPPGVLSLTYGGLPAGPCRLSVYRRGPADYTLEQARVCDQPADLARDGGDPRLDIVILDDQG